MIEVKYFGATNYLNSRLRLHSPRFTDQDWEDNRRVDTVWIYCSADYDSVIEEAAAYLKSLGYNIIGSTETSGGFGIISDTFCSLKEMRAGK